MRTPKANGNRRQSGVFFYAIMASTSCEATTHFMTATRYLLANASILTLLSVSCSRKPVAPEAGIIKVKIFLDGHITLNGSKCTFDLMRQSFTNLAKQNGTVYYYREPMANGTDEQAMRQMEAINQVMDAIGHNRLNLRYSTRPDYSDSITNAAVGPGGILINQ